MCYALDGGCGDVGVDSFDNLESKELLFPRHVLVQPRLQCMSCFGVPTSTARVAFPRFRGWMPRLFIKGTESQSGERGRAIRKDAHYAALRPHLPTTFHIWQHFRGTFRVL